MFKYLAVFLVAAVVLTEGCPSINGRSSWGARSPKKTTNLRGKAKYVIIHHTTGNQCGGTSACANQIKGIQNEHMGSSRNYDDIGYNFLIDKSGNIYEGRGWGKSGAHAPGYNSKSVGISVLGNYENSPVSDSAKTAIENLIACGVSSGKIASDYKLLGHRQTKATACPGEKLYQQVKTWPHWSSSP